jgi:predicted nucleic acid-binding protein
VSVFADTSAVVKLYADEPGQAAIRQLDAMYVSHLCRVEAPAALWRKVRLGELEAEVAATLVAASERDYLTPSGRLAPVRVDSATLDRAAALAAVHGLGADAAIQLAGALTVRDADSTCQTVAVSDLELRQAAAREGFRVVP